MRPGDVLSTQKFPYFGEPWIVGQVYPDGSVALTGQYTHSDITQSPAELNANGFTSGYTPFPVSGTVTPQTTHKYNPGDKLAFGNSTQFYTIAQAGPTFYQMVQALPGADVQNYQFSTSEVDDPQGSWHPYVPPLYTPPVVVGSPGSPTVQPPIASGVGGGGLLLLFLAFAFSKKSSHRSI